MLDEGGGGGGGADRRPSALAHIDLLINGIKLGTLREQTDFLKGEFHSVEKKLNFC